MTLTILSLAGLAPPVHAQVGDTPSTAAPDQQTHVGVGTVNRVDPKAGKVNLTHEPIKSLGWPGMTMDFVAADREQLAALKPGQRITFAVKSLGNQYVISDIRPVAPGR